MVTEQLLLNHYIAAINAIKGLELKYDELFVRAVADFKSLKNGVVGLDELEVTDEGWKINGN